MFSGENQLSTTVEKQYKMKSNAMKKKQPTYPRTYMYECSELCTSAVFLGFKPRI